MKSDVDLTFLQHCTNNDLRVLCDILTKDNKGEIRFTEQLTNKDSYICSYPQNMKGMWQDIAAELQRYGGNTFLNLFRHGRGPSYESIVLDVCKKMGVKDLGEHDTAEDMERKLLCHVTEKMVDELSEDEIKQMMRDLEIEGRSYTKQGVMAALLLAKTVNRKLFLRIIQYLTRLVADVLVGRGVMMAGLGLLSRGTQLLFGPIGWVICCAWTAWDIAGPAYRVIVPAVLQVAYMRIQYQVQHTKQIGYAS